MTVAGKTLNEHLEAVGHAQSFDYIWDLAKKTGQRDIDLETILTIHRLIVNKVDQVNAGRLRRIPVRVVGSRGVFPNYASVPVLLDKLIGSIQADKTNICLKAAQAHLDFVSIHPFVDGNGRTARLLMNLILLQSGYPPAIIGKKDRLKYLDLLERAQTEGQKEPFYLFIFKAIGRSLDICLKPSLPTSTDSKLFKIGELSRLTKVPVSSLRYWSSLGLIKLDNRLPSNYRLFSNSAVGRVEQIKKLQAKRLTLREIKQELDDE